MRYNIQINSDRATLLLDRSWVYYRNNRCLQVSIFLNRPSGYLGRWNRILKHMAKRIETITSRTAELTCISRAFSVMEKRKYYKSDDFIAPLLLPTWFRNTIRLPFARTIFTRVVAPKGIYEYVISRTKYIDSVFNQAILQNFNQILIFGAGFDSRAIRFQNKIGQIKIFELDVIVTQQSKIKQYQRRKLMIPENLTFIPMAVSYTHLRAHET